VQALSRLLAFALLALSGAPRADEALAVGVVKRFIGCPVYRDTDAGRKSGCWLASDAVDGVQYDITSGRIKPILGQQVLVEGVATDAGRELCGGVVLEPVSVSVLDETCKAFLIPAEHHPGRRFALPAETMQPTSVPRALPLPPYSTSEYTIRFELNSDFLVYQYAEIIIEKAVLYAKASKPRRVLITGYAATRGAHISGQRIREDLAIAEARARMVAEAFTRLGVPRELLRLEWRAEPANAAPPDDDGLVEAAKRRVEIRIEV
jgi:outer membrane protein OmpA-like peptidoglycan-associated protein